MQLLRVVIQGVGETILLRYKTRAVAEKNFASVESLRYDRPDNPSNLHLTDDYGMELTLAPYSVLFSVLIDVDKSLEGDTTYQLDSMRVGQRVQQQYGNPAIVPAAAGVLNGLPRRN